MLFRVWVPITAFTMLFALGCTTSSDPAVAVPQTETTSTDIAAEPTTTPTTTPTTVSSADAESTTTPETAGGCAFDVLVVFDEGAPRDRITIQNLSDASIDSVSFDLSPSAGNLIFDTDEGGQGVEVFQDFQEESGAAILAVEPIASDGASDLELSFDSFAGGDEFVFSLDVDDQLADSDLGQIQVTGSEIAGATVQIGIQSGQSASATFDDTAQARTCAG